jgi:hypothetical protein
MMLKHSGNVGIGTDVPAATPPTGWGSSGNKALEIKSSIPNGATGVLMRRSDNVTGADVWSDNANGSIYIDNYYNNVNGDIVFRTARTTEQMRIEGTGNVIVKTGNLVIGTSGKGIDFSATSDGSGTTGSEVLDDYEEGTWSPKFTEQTAGTGTYVKVGKLVTVRGLVVADALGTSTALIHTGLPFAAVAETMRFHLDVQQANSAGTGNSVSTPFNGQAIYMVDQYVRGTSTGINPYYRNNLFKVGSRIRIEGTFEVA